MNFFQYACYFAVPRIACAEDGVLQVEVPWARAGADLTFLFESLAMTLCREMPVNTVSKILKVARPLRVDDNKLWRMPHRYTEAARAHEDHSEIGQIGVDETSKWPGHCECRGHDHVSLCGASGICF